MGFVVLAAPVPWDLGPCPATQTDYQQTEYRQMFTHGENVPQKPLDLAQGPVGGLRLWEICKQLDVQPTARERPSGVAVPMLWPNLGSFASGSGTEASTGHGSLFCSLERLA